MIKLDYNAFIPNLYSKLKLILKRNLKLYSNKVTRQSNWHILTIDTINKWFDAEGAGTSTPTRNQKYCRKTSCFKKNPVQLQKKTFLEILTSLILLSAMSNSSLRSCSVCTWVSSSSSFNSRNASYEETVT